MVTVLIDPTGEIWDAHAWQLRSRYGVAVSDSAFPDFLVRNLGFVAFTRSHDGCAVRVAPARVANPTFAAFVRLITEFEPKRTALALYDGQWQHQLHRGSLSVRKEIMRRMLTTRNGRADKVLSVSRRLEDLNRQSAISQLVDIWHDGGRHIDLPRHVEFLNNAFSGKFMLLERASGTGQIKFATIGPGIDPYHGDDWRAPMDGQRVNDQPDIEYGRWVVGCYRETLILDEPTLMDVDAIVDDPLVREQRRLQYTRLALPIGPVGQASHLLTATLSDPHVDLRVEFHNELE